MLVRFPPCGVDGGPLENEDDPLRLVSTVIKFKSCAYSFSPTDNWRPGADAIAASMGVLIAAGPLPQDPQARTRHEAGLVQARVAAAAAVVRGAVPPIVVPAPPPPPALVPAPHDAVAPAPAQHNAPAPIPIPMNED